MKACKQSLFALLVALLNVCAARSQDKVQTVLGTPNNEFRVVKTYPEYWVDGKPYLMYSASFLYMRIPRDRWAEELMHQQRMGINTVEILPMWAWHEPEEGKFDFDGHTSPRRDLDYLVRLIDILGLKLSVRPGPYLTGEWRNGGYPEWLLRRPEYRMSEQSILENRYPRWSALQYQKSDEAATEWLKNETHLRYTRQWYHDILGRLKPELAQNGGPLINIQIDDDQASGRENYNGPNFWKYMNLLRQYAKEATDNSPIPYYIDGEDMRVNAESNDATSEPFWNTGQEYLFSQQHMTSEGYSTIEEAAKNKFFTEILKTQPLAVAGHIEFQASWFPSWNDTQTIHEDPSNQLMASSVMFQNGLKMLNYYPPSDTLYPAGFETPSTNHFYSWDVAVNFAGKETARAATTRRYGRLLNGMAPLLGSVHLLPDAGIIYSMATYPQASMTPEEAGHIAAFGQRLLWSGVSDNYNFELIDSDHTPIDNFLRYKVLILFNPVYDKEDLKEYPHLGEFSERAQKLVKEYVEAGGTLIVFPSLPKGEIFNKLFSRLGDTEKVPENGMAAFADGEQVSLLDAYSVLRNYPVSRNSFSGTGSSQTNADALVQGGAVSVFARDERGEAVGARYVHGKGQVVFFGADFSLWSMPAGSETAHKDGDKEARTDYPEELQESTRSALPELMKEVGIERKVYGTGISEKPRDVGIYTTELVSDAGSRPLGMREQGAPRYGFVGVTNFSIDRSWKADIYATDPALTDLNTTGTVRYLHLPGFVLPPRQALLMPIHLPLSSSQWQFAPGLTDADEVVYATAELSKVEYNGTSLRLEFTAPTDGEVSLKLTELPEGAAVDGKVSAIHKDAKRGYYTVQIPRGDAPHFLRVVEIMYRREQPRMTIATKGSWIAGESPITHVRIENPGPELLQGDLDLDAGRLTKGAGAHISASIPGKSGRVFDLHVQIPADAPEGQPAQLKATFRERNSTIAWEAGSQVVLHRPFELDIHPKLDFPLRQDQSFPITHPTLISLALPGTAVIQLHIKNHLDRAQEISIRAKGPDLDFAHSTTHLRLAPQQERTAAIRVLPSKGSNAYPFQIEANSGEYSIKEDAMLAAVKPGEAIAYHFDYDRDGFADVIMENPKVRLFVSPNAGGRAFGFVLKDSPRNAFDSVGGMRDTFTTRIEPEDRKGADWERAGWGGLYNRPYASHVASASGTQAEVYFNYLAPDIYPNGVELERTLKLSGTQNIVIENTSITPFGIGKPQAFVLETSLPFNVFDQPNDSDWFVQGTSEQEFVPSKTLSLPDSAAYFGAKTKDGNQVFAAIPITPPSQVQMNVEKHSALLRFVYPDFSQDHVPHAYSMAYYLNDRGEMRDVDAIAVELKAKN